MVKWAIQRGNGLPLWRHGHAFNNVAIGCTVGGGLRSWGIKMAKVGGGGVLVGWARMIAPFFIEGSRSAFVRTVRGKSLVKMFKLRYL